MKKELYKFTFQYTSTKILRVAITYKKRRIEIPPNEYIVKNNTLTLKKNPKDYFRTTK